MKRCPNCNQFFEDDNVFCFNDGTPLIPIADANPNRVVISWADKPPVTEMPPQFVMPAPPPANAPRNDNSKFLYTILGALAAGVIFIGAGFFFLRPASDKNTVEASKKSSPDSASSLGSSTSNTDETPSNSSKKDEKIAPKPIFNAGSNAPTNAPAMNTMPAANTPSSGFRLTRNFNRTFSGTAGDDGISMRLQRSGSSLSGRVFSRRSVTEISVSGNIYDDGSFEMNEYSDIGAVTGVYQGRIYSDGTMSGTWTRPDGSKSRYFSLRAN